MRRHCPRSARSIYIIISRKENRSWKSSSRASACSEDLTKAPWIRRRSSRTKTILESGPDTTEWPDARDKITRVRGKKLTVSDAYARLIEEDLESITADYEASPGTYVENREASREMLAEACRVEWIE